METTLPRVSPYPIPELAEFLRPFRPQFYRCESLGVLQRYATGLLAELERKSGAGIAQAVAGLSESAVYRLLAQSRWDAAAVNRQRLKIMLAQAVAGDGMLVFDDSGFPRQGSKSVGVAHQYCGALGKTANCQVAVTAHYVDPYFAWPAFAQLYLPEAWCQNAERRHKAQIPAAIAFQTKPELALALLDQARAAEMPFQWVGADAGYGDNPNFLDGVASRHLDCVVSVAADFGVRLLDEVAHAAVQPLPPKKKAGGRRRTHPHPVQVAELHRADAVLASQPETAWQTITWRLGSEGPLTKQFIAPRVQRSHGEITGPKAGCSVSALCLGRRAITSSIGAVCRPPRPWRGWRSWPIAAPVLNGDMRTAKDTRVWATMRRVCGIASSGTWSSRCWC